MKLSEAILMILKSIALPILPCMGFFMIVGGSMMAIGVGEYLVTAEGLTFSSRFSGVGGVLIGIFFEVMAFLLYQSVDRSLKLTADSTSEPVMVTVAIIISEIAGGFTIILFSALRLMIGVVLGAVILISAMMLKIRPGEGTHGFRTCCRIWGTMILVFSIISFFAEPVAFDPRGLFFVISETLGIIGGALALIGAQNRALRS